MTKNNRGYSLIELIVVIAILMIVAGGTILGVGVLSGKPADQCASSLNMAFSSHRVSAKGKAYDASKTYLIVKKESDDCIYTEESIDGNKTTLKICSKGVDLSYVQGGVTKTLSPGNSIKFTFDRATGAFKVGDDISLITIKKASREYNLTLYNLTGKVKLSKIR